jgi:hypothetical protein
VCATERILAEAAAHKADKDVAENAVQAVADNIMSRERLAEACKAEAAQKCAAAAAATVAAEAATAAAAADKAAAAAAQAAAAAATAAAEHAAAEHAAAEARWRDAMQQLNAECVATRMPCDAPLCAQLAVCLGPRH